MVEGGIGVAEGPLDPGAADRPQTVAVVVLPRMVRDLGIVVRWLAHSQAESTCLGSVSAPAIDGKRLARKLLAVTIIRLRRPMNASRGVRVEEEGPWTGRGLQGAGQTRPQDQAGRQRRASHDRDSDLRLGQERNLRDREPRDNVAFSLAIEALKVSSADYRGRLSSFPFQRLEATSSEPIRPRLT